jgi:hypothetical protein
MSKDAFTYDLTFTDSEMNFLYQVLDNVQVKGVTVVLLLNDIITKFTASEYQAPLPVIETSEE